MLNKLQCICQGLGWVRVTRGGAPLKLHRVAPIRTRPRLHDEHRLHLPESASFYGLFTFLVYKISIAATQPKFGSSRRAQSNRPRYYRWPPRSHPGGLEIADIECPRTCRVFNMLDVIVILRQSQLDSDASTLSKTWKAKALYNFHPRSSNILLHGYKKHSYQHQLNLRSE